MYQLLTETENYPGKNRRKSGALKKRDSVNLTDFGLFLADFWQNNFTSGNPLLHSVQYQHNPPVIGRKALPLSITGIYSVIVSAKLPKRHELK